MIEETRNQFLAVCPIQVLMKADNFGVFDAVAKHPQKTPIQFRFLTESLSQPIGSTKTILEKVQRSSVILRERNPDLGRSLSPRMVIRDEDEILLFFAPGNDSGWTTHMRHASGQTAEILSGRLHRFLMTFGVTRRNFRRERSRNWSGEKPSTYFVLP